MTVVEPKEDGDVTQEVTNNSETEEAVLSDSETSDVQEGEDTAATPEKPLDDDLDRRNPQYIPKGGAFYEHDNRTLVEDEEKEASAEAEKKKKVWKESKSSERWLHDCYDENEQNPKSAQELIDVYGYDIRNEESAPRARRRRKYGRGPDKYDRKWNDEEAYMTSQRRGHGRGRRAEDFPPLPNHSDAPPGRGRQPPMATNSKWRGGRIPEDASSIKREVINNNVVPNSKGRGDDNIKPFMHDSGRSQQLDIPSQQKSNRPPVKSSHKELQDLSRTMSQMTVHEKQKPKESPGDLQPSKSHADSPANRQNPKRYSKIRRRYFPPEEIAELDEKQAMELQQTAPPRTIMQPGPHISPQQQPEMLAQGVLQRYPDTYNGNPAFLSARPILQPIPQPGLSPQGLPTQALSPQLPGMPGLEMAPASLPPQANFVPPLYIDMEAHYPGQGEVLPFQGYTAYPPQGQNSEVYQASSGITYYSPEVQASTGQVRALPPRRPKAAIPIVAPPETH